jgi:hypothetical protein|nr:MAG TPA: Trm112p-like protein [Caudoviricetes sp.]
MTRIDVRDLKGKIKDNAVQVTLDVIGKKHDLMLAYQNTGFGKKRFFLCPYCSKNVQYLYITGNGLKCRTCGDVKYTGIQNNTKGGYDEIAYRMKKYAAAHDIQFSFPFNYLDFVLDDRMHREKFRNYVIVLQALENMRFQGIICKTTYSAKTIRLVTSGKHPLLQKCSLMELKEYFYDWETGQQIIIPSVKSILK